MRGLVAGTRGSALALWQTRHVCDLLRQHLARRATVGEQVIETRGDRDLRERLQGQLEKGFFTEELEQALRARRIDLAVHSLKDLPTKNAPGLVLGAVLPRENPCDWLLARPASVGGDGGLDTLPIAPGARVGTSSLRRQSLLARYAPGCTALPLRGNVPTRVERLREGQYDAIVLAAAGARRLALDLSPFTVFELDARRWPTAPGQGAVAVQCREDDGELRGWLDALHHPVTARAVAREREWLAELEGGCTTPFGCYLEDGRVHLGIDVGGRWRYQALEDAAYSERARLRMALAHLTSDEGFSEEASHDPHRRALARPV